MISKLAALGSRIFAVLERFQGFPILLARLVLGVGFCLTGYGKLENHGKVVDFFTSLGIPLPGLNAWFVGGVEFFGGMLLIAGLASRIAAFLLSCTMLVASLTSTLPDLRKDGKPFTDVLLTTEVLALVLLVWLVFSGAGIASLDRLIAKKVAPAAASKPAG